MGLTPRELDSEGLMWLWLLTIPIGGYVAYRALTKKNDTAHTLPATTSVNTVPAVSAPIQSVISAVAQAQAVDQTISAAPDPEISDGYSSADSSGSSASKAPSTSKAGAAPVSAVMPIAAAVTANPPPLAPSLTGTNPVLATIANASAILPTASAVPPVIAPPPLAPKLTTANPTLATIAKASAILPTPPVPPPIVGLPKISSPKTVVLPPAPAAPAGGFNFSPQYLASNKLQAMLDAIPLDVNGKIQNTTAATNALNDIRTLMKQNLSLSGKAKPAVKAWLVSHAIAASRL